MDDEEPGHQAAVASAAAAALVAALRQRPAGSFAGQVAAAAFGADPEVVHCSIAVILDSSSGAICSSGNLLRPHEASSLHCSTSSLAGITIAQRRPRLLHGRLLRRHAMQDAAAILTECSAVQTLVCLPLLWPAHSHSGTSRTALGALTVGYASAPSAPALRRALVVAQALAQQQRGELHSFAGLVSDMLLPQRLHGSTAGPSEALSDSDADEGLFDSDWGWSSSGPSDATPNDSDNEAEPGGRRRSSSGAAPPSCLAQHPLTLRFQEAQVEAQFAQYQARCLQRVDALAYLFVLLLFGFEVVLPVRLGAWAGSPEEQPPGPPSLLALLPGLLPGLLLLHPRTHSWFSAHRDHLLLGTWLYTAVYSRTQLAPRQLLGWLGVLGLALPMRFFRLLPLTLLASAQLLHAVSPRQLVHTVVLPLACSWYFEAHSRAAFVRANLSAPRS